MSDKEIFTLAFEGEGEVALVSCFVNSDPAEAICRVIDDKMSGMTRIYPLFVSITDAMELTDSDGTLAVPPPKETLN